MEGRTPRLALPGLCGALAAVSPAPAGGQIPCRYELTAVIRGPWCNQIFQYPPTFADGLGSDGRVVGHYQSCDIGPDRAFMWSAGSGLTTLPRPTSYPGSRAFDIDANANWIVGSLVTGPNVGERPVATLWAAGVPTVLGIPPGGNFSEAVAVSNSRIAGTWGNSEAGPALRAFLWQGETMIDIDLPMGPNAVASAVNWAGAVVGWMGQSTTINSHAYLWQDGNTTDIGVVPGGFTAHAVAVNNADPPEVVGSGQVPVPGAPLGEPRAFHWTDGRMTQLSPGAWAYALDINDESLIVGALLRDQALASIWHQGVWMDLNDLVADDAGVHLDYAWAVNDQGQIAGWGFDGHDGVGFLLTPVQSPPGDLNCDGAVNHDDLSILVDAWGPCNQGQPCPADIDGDDAVGIVDFLLLLANWG